MVRFYSRVLIVHCSAKMTRKQQTLARDTQHVAVTACRAFVRGRRRAAGRLAVQYGWAVPCSPRADARPIKQLPGTKLGSPSCRRVVFLCFGLVLSVAVSWQGL